MFPQLVKSALKILVSFATTHLCETGFSTLVSIKTEARNRLNPGDDMHVAITKKEPRSSGSLKKGNNKKAISDKYFNA